MDEFFSLKSNSWWCNSNYPIRPVQFIKYIKNKMNPKVDQYLLDGCMRCKYGGTPKCKVNNWINELEELRKIVIKSGLVEELKWGMPCYTSNNKNILMISAFKDYACISFFKGVLLKDKEKLLVAHGENSQSVRIIKYTNSDQIIQQTRLIKTYIKEAIEIEKLGLKIEHRNNELVLPEELINQFKKNARFKKAFNGLTPGRQRAYNLFFSAAKQAATRETRIEKYKKQILDGKGINDCTCGLSLKMPYCDGSHKQLTK